MRKLTVMMEICSREIHCSETWKKIEINRRGKITAMISSEVWNVDFTHGQKSQSGIRQFRPCHEYAATHSQTNNEEIDIAFSPLP